MKYKSQDWHRIDIKSVLEKKGITPRELSRSVGLPPDSLRNVFPHSRSREGRIITQALETTPGVIWLSHYQSELEENVVLKNDYQLWAYDT